MNLTLNDVEELVSQNLFFWNTNACGFLTYLYLNLFIEKGLCPRFELFLLINDLIRSILCFRITIVGFYFSNEKSG